jgi:hypothetical protein
MWATRLVAKAVEKEPLMNSFALKILLTVYILYALLKFFEFFFRDEATKMKGLYTVYVKGGAPWSKPLTTASWY